MHQSLFLYLLLLGGVAAAQTATNSSPAQAAGPRIAFDSTNFDFGKVKSGEPAKHSFVFTNTGTATLEITEVRPGCGCTTAGAWDKSVTPGKTGVIPLEFNSTGYGSGVTKSATVICNDPGRSNVILQLTGLVWKPIDITPAMATFTLSSEASTKETRVLHVVSNLEEPVTLSDLKCSSASFTVELKETKPGKEFDLEVTAVPPFTNPTVYASITFKSSSTNAPIVNASAYATMQQAVAVIPQQVTLPPGPLKSPVTSAVVVRNNSTNALAISDVRLDIPGVDVKVNEPETGRVYSVVMTFPVGFQLQPDQKPELTFKSSHPKFPELKVPVIQIQAVAAAPGAAQAGPGLLRTASPLGSAPRGPASPASAGSAR